MVRDRSRRALGEYGETLAARYLSVNGFDVVDRNWRGADGEVDIVAWDGPETLVFVEVKTRSGTGFGTPAQAITTKKVARLRRLAAQWLQDHDLRPEQVRIDTIGVVTGGTEGTSLEHLRGVYR